MSHIYSLALYNLRVLNKVYNPGVIIVLISVFLYSVTFSPDPKNVHTTGSFKADKTPWTTPRTTPKRTAQLHRNHSPTRDSSTPPLVLHDLPATRLRNSEAPRVSRDKVKHRSPMYHGLLIPPDISRLE